MHVEKEAEIKLYVEGANELTQTKRDSAAALKKMRTDLRLKQVWYIHLLCVLLLNTTKC